ncbi:MAG: hypothetical protein AAB150_19820 [Pseudomonadota bacterium]
MKATYINHIERVQIFGQTEAAADSLAQAVGKHARATNLPLETAKEQVLANGRKSDEKGKSIGE